MSCNIEIKSKSLQLIKRKFDMVELCTSNTFGEYIIRIFLLLEDFRIEHLSLTYQIKL